MLVLMKIETGSDLTPVWAIDNSGLNLPVYPIDFEGYEWLVQRSLGQLYRPAPF
jgi:hypothetical protein